MPSTNPIGKAVGLFNTYGRAAKAAIDVTVELAKQVDQTAKKIITAADAIGGRWVRVNDIAFKTARTMAMSREEAVKYNDALFKSTRAIASQFGITYREIDNFQKSYAEAIGRNVVLTIQQKEQMAALSKITDAATAARLVDEFDKVGVGITRATAYTGRLQERAKALGVSPAKATKTMADNIKLAASYSFRNGVNDIEKMAMRATSMRMDMNAIMSATEKFANIEDAIGTSANIQMLGGSFAREFSNPMGVMYESMADPKAFQERILRTVQGKGRYDAKTGAVTFDPVTMRMMRELAKNLGMTVDQITNPAMAEVQNQKVKEELQSAGKWNNWSKEQQIAIQNLSRTNVNEETGKHFVTYLDENGNVVERNIEDLTKEELKIAQDRQMSEENMFSDVQEIKDILKRTLDRARDTTSVKEKERGLMDLWDSGIVGGLQNLYMPFVSGIYNKVGNWLGGLFGGGKYAQGGVVKPIAHANFGTIVPGDSYMGDHTPVMANGGEMILNPMQQKSMFNLISTLALTGGASKVGSMMGVKGLGTTTLMASALGGGDPSIKNFVEAYFLKKFIKNMIPLKENIGEISNVTETATKSTSLFKENWKELTNTLHKDWSSFTRRISITTKRYFTTGKLGTVTRGVGNIASAVGTKTAQFGSYIGKYAKSIGETIGRYTIKPISSGISKGWEGLKNSKLGVATQTKIGDAQLKLLRAKLGYKDLVKPKLNEYSKLVRNLFNDGSKAQASKIASRYGKLGTPEVAMTGRVTGVSQAAETTAKAASKSGKLMSGLSKVGKSLAPAAKFISKKLPVIGNVLAVGGAISSMSSASSQYDAKIDEIERSGMSDLDKARAKDRAAKEKNASYGSSIGSVAGTAIGGALGSALGPLGTMAGMWLGEKAGSFLGKGIGSLFGGGEEKKVKEEREKLFAGKEGIASNEDAVKVLTSIDNKMSIITGKDFGVKAKSLSSPSLPKVSVKTIGTVAGTAIGSILGPLGMVAGGLVGSKISDGVKSLPINGNFMKVNPTKDSDTGVGRPSSVGKTDINLNVSGTIKLEGGGKSVDFDLAKLIDTPEFKRQLADIVTRRINESSNSGKRNMESERNNMASQYNKSGK